MQAMWFDFNVQKSYNVNVQLCCHDNIALKTLKCKECLYGSNNTPILT